jgi:hypothetical protein
MPVSAEPCQSLPCLPCLARPHHALPSPAIPYLPCHATPSSDSPSLPCRAQPGLTRTDHALPGRSWPAEPVRFEPSAAPTCLPRPAGPCHAVTCLPYWILNFLITSFSRSEGTTWNRPNPHPAEALLSGRPAPIPTCIPHRDTRFKTSAILNWSMS